MNPLRRLVFPPTSRYHDIETATLVVGEDVEIPYLRRRFLPPSDRFTTIQEHVVVTGGSPRQRHRALPGRPAAVLACLRCQPRDESAGPDGARAGGFVSRCRKASPGFRMLVSGAFLTLLIGPSVPLPAPPPVIEALKSVQVNTSADRTGFQLTFTIGKTSLLQLALLPAGYFDPIITRVVIVVTLNGIPNVLVDGFVTRQEMQPASEPGQSTLTITGEDLTVAMDLMQITVSYPAMPDVAQVNLILAKYAFLGVVPVVVPPFLFTVKTPLDGWITQTETDLQHIRGLARQNGFVFYIEPGPLPGQSIAYFGPDVRVPLPQPALSVNMDAHTNVESLSFSLDGLQKRIEIITVLDPVTGRIPIPVPMPEINVFKPPLGLRPTAPAKIVFDREAAALTFDEALKLAIGRGIASSAPVTGNGTLNVLRYGQVLRARTLIGVRGAGPTYDGLYYVDGVTHNIKTGEYKQSFNLSRDGLISNTPVVVP